MARITGLTKDVSTIELRLRRDGAETPLQASSDAEASTGARSPSPQRRLRRTDVGGQGRSAGAARVGLPGTK